MKCPPLVYGTAWKGERTESLVRQALARGFRGIDTAGQPKHYDEAAVGAALEASLGPKLGRNDLYLQTKFTPVRGQDPRRMPYDASLPIAAQVAESFRSSLRNLRTDRVDAYVLHSPIDTMAQTLAAWQAMETCVGSGEALSLGISNCYDLETLRALDRAARVKPVVLQNRFYADTGYDRELRAFCRERDILYQSFWTLTANPQVLADRAVVDIAKRRRRTPAQIFLRYLTQEGVTPLTGTTSSAHMIEDLAIFEFELDAAERASIGELL